MLSCYAPTWAASRQDKDNFLNQLDAFITSVPTSDCYVILGDFNARIGSRSDGEDDLWGGVLGPHGYGEINPFTAVAAIWRLEVITHAAICLTLADKYF